MDHLSVPDWLGHTREIWGQAWPGYSLIAMSFLVFLWLERRLPPPGYAITAMAVIAGAMALRPDMGGWEKSLWFVILLLFAGIEIRAISKDRKEQTKTFSDIAAKLTVTVDQGTIALTALNETIREGRTHFDSTISGLTDSMKTQTGGDSFCYLEFTQALNDVGGMQLVKVGKYSPAKFACIEDFYIGGHHVALRTFPPPIAPFGNYDSINNVCISNPDGKPSGKNIFSVFHDAWDALKNPNLYALPVPLRFSYQDDASNLFEGRCDLVYYPVEHGKRVLGKDAKAIDVKNIKLRKVAAASTPVDWSD